MERKNRGIRSLEKKTLVLVPSAGCWTSVVQVPFTRAQALPALIRHAAGKHYPGSINENLSMCWTILSAETKQDQQCLVSLPLGERIVFTRDTVPAIHALSRHVLSRRQKLFGNKTDIHALVLSEPLHELLSFSRGSVRHRLLDDKALADFLAEGESNDAGDQVLGGLAARQSETKRPRRPDVANSKKADIACLDTRIRGEPLLHERILHIVSDQLKMDKSSGLSYGGTSLRRPALLIPVLLIAASVLGLLARTVIERDSIVRDQKKQITRFERELSDYEGLISQLDAAQKQVEALRSQLPVGVYSLLELLSQSFVQGDRLQSVHYEHESRTLSLSVVSGDAIRLLDSLSKSGILNDVKSSGITPVGDSPGKMRLTLSAKVVQ